jgi:hypothetical protein
MYNLMNYCKRRRKWQELVIIGAIFSESCTGPRYLKQHNNAIYYCSMNTRVVSRTQESGNYRVLCVINPVFTTMY